MTTLGSPGVLVAVISRHGERYYIEKVQGDGRGAMDGAPMGRTPQLLHDGDTLEMTGTRMRFFCQRIC